ncbi:vitamin-D-receptor interacting mediator subunit 4-domain-containing protein [Cladochytrium replicatum]|nr:vitamin-D-receptor interacting mediator subunit 4-domain-containing protein [Cladochytrium replicatum]
MGSVLKENLTKVLDECAGTVRELFVSLDFLTQETAKKQDGSLFQHLRPPIESGLEAFDAPVAEQHPWHILHKLLSLDTQLDGLLDQLEEHQAFQRKIEEQEAEIEYLNGSILGVVKRLQTAERKLEEIVTDTRQKVQIMKRANQGVLDHKELVSYAHRVARYTSAPPNWKPNAPTGVPVFPPIPQDMHMKMSLLSQPDRARAVVTTQEEVEMQADLAMDLDVFAATSMAGIQPKRAPEETNEELLDLDF